MGKNLTTLAWRAELAVVQPAVLDSWLQGKLNEALHQAGRHGSLRKRMCAIEPADGNVPRLNVTVGAR